MVKYQNSTLEALFSRTYIVYILCSCLFWIALMFVGWVQYYDPKLGDMVPIHKVDSVFFVLHLMLYSTLLIALGVCVGFVLSIPAILGRLYFEYRILVARKKYKRIFSLVLVAQYFPFFLLIFSNSAFYYANKSTKIENHFLYNSNLTKLDKNYGKIGKENPNGYFVFFVPSYLLNDDRKLSNTKLILSHQGRLFLETSSKAEMASLLIRRENNDVDQYYAPAQIKDKFGIMGINTKISTDTILIGVDKKNTPEFLNLFSENVITRKTFRLTKSAILSNRMMASLKPVHLALRLGIPGILNSNWRWENFGNSSLDILLNNSSIMLKKSASKYNFIFLSDLEKTPTKSLFLGSSDLMDSKDLLFAEQNLDKNLFTAIKALLTSGVQNIAILPYKGKGLDWDEPLANFFTNTPITAGIKSYRTFFHEYPEDFVCKTQSIPGSYEGVVLNKSMLLDSIKFSKTEIPYLDPEYEVYMKRFFSTARICYEKNENIYVLVKSDKELTNNMTIYKVTAQNTFKTLQGVEKNNFISKYTYEIFN